MDWRDAATAGWTEQIERAGGVRVDSGMNAAGEPTPERVADEANGQQAPASQPAGPGEQEFVVSDDFTMLPYYGPEPRAVSASALTAWIVGFALIVAGLALMTVTSLASDGCSPEDGRCALGQVAAMGGGLLAMFFGGVFVVAGFALGGRSRRKNRDEQERMDAVLRTARAMLADAGTYPDDEPGPRPGTEPGPSAGPPTGSGGPAS